MSDCPHCGKQTPAYWRFCFECDARYTDEEITGFRFDVGEQNPRRKFSASIDARHGHCHACGSPVAPDRVFGAQIVQHSRNAVLVSPLPTWFDPNTVMLFDGAVSDLNLLRLLRVLSLAPAADTSEFSEGFWVDVLLEQLPLTTEYSSVFLRPCSSCGDRDPLLLAGRPEEANLESRNANDRVSSDACYSCGRPYSRGAKFCSSCGAALPHSSSPNEQKPAVPLLTDAASVSDDLQLLKEAASRLRENLAVEMEVAAQEREAQERQAVVARAQQLRDIGDNDIRRLLCPPCHACNTAISVSDAFEYVTERSMKYDIFSFCPDWVTDQTPRLRSALGKDLAELLFDRARDAESWDHRLIDAVVKPCPMCKEQDPWRIGTA